MRPDINEELMSQQREKWKTLLEAVWSKRAEGLENKVVNIHCSWMLALVNKAHAGQDSAEAMGGCTEM